MYLGTNILGIHVFLSFHRNFAARAQEFHGIGMNASMKLTGKMLVLADDKQIVCIYPYRDAETTKITEKTRNVVIVGYGAPHIRQNQLIDAVETALSFIRQTSSGEIETVSIFKSEGDQ